MVHFKEPCGTKLDDVISQYNQDYFCKIESYEFTDDEIIIYIDMKGSDKDGEIQHPKHSILYEINSETKIPLVRFEFSFENPIRGYRGFLAYDKKALISGSYHFCFGICGYSAPFIFNY